MHSVDNSRSSGEYYYRLYWVHVLIRHYLTTGRKYALIKKYALNKHVRLLTRLYGTESLIPLCYRVTPVHSFVDYIKGGCQINLLVAVDFTVSTSLSQNGNRHHDSLSLSS